MNVLVLSSLHSVLQSRLLLHFGSSLTTHIVYTGCPYRGSPTAAKFGKTPYYSILVSILPTIVQLNEHKMELVQYHTLQHYFCPYLTASNNEFMSGPLDIQDIKGEMNAEAEHDAGSLPD